MTTTSVFDLSGRVALVTGAGSGIGRAIALGLAQAGAAVAVTYRTDATTTIGELQGIGCRTAAYHCDMASLDDSAGQLLVEQVLSDFGRLDILVNNAGQITVAPAAELSAEQWNREIQVNLTATFVLSQAALSALSVQGGSIINIGSLLSLQGSSMVAAYTAAKSGLAGLTRALALEWAPLGIRVNALAPGYVRTAMAGRLLEDAELRAPIDARIPLGRWADPEDIAGPVTFLASDAARYVTGVVLPVDGGWLAG
ncbi:MAG: SDR family NAD(P)-dependent oxidoreductase [Actinomycetales bacterium]